MCRWYTPKSVSVTPVSMAASQGPGWRSLH
jgi:hypothetical protein